MNIFYRTLAVSAFLAFPGVLMASGPAKAAPAAEGKQLFKTKCAACHTDTRGKASPIGPPLFGVVGRRSGTVPNTRYSKRMAGLGVTWSTEALDKFLADPKALVPGTTMAAPPVRSVKERQDIIAYLATLK